MARRGSRGRHKSSPWSVLARKSRWTAEEARALFDAQAKSGEAVAAFARRHGLGLPRLYAWRRRLGGLGTAVPLTRLLPVRIAAGHEVPAEAIEIEFCDGRRLRVPQTFDAAALGRVIDVLERSNC